MFDPDIRHALGRAGRAFVVLVLVILVRAVLHALGWVPIR